MSVVLFFEAGRRDFFRHLSEGVFDESFLQKRTRLLSAQERRIASATVIGSPSLSVIFLCALDASEPQWV